MVVPICLTGDSVQEFDANYVVLAVEANNFSSYCCFSLRPQNFSSN
jgi:hypothetical protein